MLPSFRSLALTSMILAGATSARAEEDPWPRPKEPRDLNLIATDATEYSVSVLSFKCEFLKTESRTDYTKITCFFSTTIVNKPTPQKLAEHLAMLNSPEGDQEVRDDFNGMCREIESLKSPTRLVGADQTAPQLLDRIRTACKLGDFAAFKAVYVDQFRDIWAKTCTITNYGTRKYEFTRVNDTTWRGVDSHPHYQPNGGGMTTVRTLWETGEDKLTARWNYKQVNSADPSCNPKTHHFCEKDSVEEWLTVPRRSLPLGECLYFESAF